MDPRCSAKLCGKNKTSGAQNKHMPTVIDVEHTWVAALTAW